MGPAMSAPVLGFIGAGPVALALGTAFERAGLHVLMAHGRSGTSGADAGPFEWCAPASLASRADVAFLTVPDDAIARAECDDGFGDAGNEGDDALGRGGELHRVPGVIDQRDRRAVGPLANIAGGTCSGNTSGCPT